MVGVQLELCELVELDMNQGKVVVLERVPQVVSLVLTGNEVVIVVLEVEPGLMVVRVDVHVLVSEGVGLEVVGLEVEL